MVHLWKRKSKAILISIYLNLSLDTETRRDRSAFVKKAYQWVLKRPADETGLNSFVNMLERGIPRWVVLEALFASDEYYWQKSKGSPGDILHSLRCKLVQQLPPAEVIVDLGGAATPAI